MLFSWKMSDLRAITTDFARTHATPAVNHEQTQHTRCCVNGYARHVMHNIERRCDAYGLLLFVPSFVTLLTPPGLQPGFRLGLGFQDVAIGLACIQLRLANEHALSCQQQHPLHVSQTRTRQVLPPASRHLAIPDVRDRPHLISRSVPGPLQPQVPHLVCV